MMGRLHYANNSVQELNYKKINFFGGHKTYQQHLQAAFMGLLLNFDLKNLSMLRHCCLLKELLILQD